MAFDDLLVQLVFSAHFLLRSSVSLDGHSYINPFFQFPFDLPCMFIEWKLTRALQNPDCAARVMQPKLTPPSTPSPHGEVVLASKISTVVSSDQSMDTPAITVIPKRSQTPNPTVRPSSPAVVRSLSASNCAHTRIIFDADTMTLPSGSEASQPINAIKRELPVEATITSTDVYGDGLMFDPDAEAQLYADNVNLHKTHGDTFAAILDEIWNFAFMNYSCPRSSTIVLVTGNIKYVRTLKRIREKGINIVVVVPDYVHPSLTSASSFDQIISWSFVLSAPLVASSCFAPPELGRYNLFCDMPVSPAITDATSSDLSNRATPSTVPALAIPAPVSRHGHHHRNYSDTSAIQFSYNTKAFEARIPTTAPIHRGRSLSDEPPKMDSDAATSSFAPHIPFQPLSVIQLAMSPQQPISTPPEAEPAQPGCSLDDLVMTCLHIIKTENTKQYLASRVGADMKKYFEGKFKKKDLSTLVPRAKLCNLLTSGGTGGDFTLFFNEEKMKEWMFARPPGQEHIG